MPADQASAVLRGLATKLYAAAARPDAAAPGLNAWAERFEAAAQSGELSKLLPNVEPAAHFGIRAYQAAGQTTAEQSELATLLRDSVALPVVQSGENSKAELAQRVLFAEAVGGGRSNSNAPTGPSASAEALALSLVRRGAAAIRLRRRRALAGRRAHSRRRRRRRWRARADTG
ncbi:MAG TPA: hypothetical protein VJV78_40155 [Polyangiales bacterium]|nr:hypothetical protein [Polyangiales bacterium]